MSRHGGFFYAICNGSPHIIKQGKEGRAIKKKKCKSRRFKIIIFLLFILTILTVSFLYFELKLSKIVANIAEQQVKANASLIISKIIFDEIEESGITYSDLIEFEKDSEGKISALKTNIIEVNRFKSKLSMDILDKLRSTDSMEVSIPIGSVFNSEIMSGYGPKLLVRTIPVGSVATDINNEIISAGINQTRHQVMLSVNVQLSVITAMKKISTEVSTNVCIAETVIVGNVPDSYTNIDASSKDDTENNSELPLSPDDIFNFVYN